ncbi:hypothetical protein [Methylocella tundrae]|nr:hypothetical protein [Methylocella tundrae]WPP02851.1 hypothetical protein SIN04_01710 [Methylocella tundrae]
MNPSRVAVEAVFLELFKSCADGFRRHPIVVCSVSDKNEKILENEGVTRRFCGRRRRLGRWEGTFLAISLSQLDDEESRLWRQSTQMASRGSWLLYDKTGKLICASGVSHALSRSAGRRSSGEQSSGSFALAMLRRRLDDAQPPGPRVECASRFRHKRKRYDHHHQKARRSTRLKIRRERA